MEAVLHFARGEQNQLVQEAIQDVRRGFYMDSSHCMRLYGRNAVQFGKVGSENREDASLRYSNESIGELHSKSDDAAEKHLRSDGFLS